ncbi:S9 family peptidase [Colwellia sp. MB3u-22]|uniref:alpha/beta hydrolase family protein n=1 Tax=unclassified Colwellia TaxID=196834 RepID=UPI0015F71589|nr:MULTISPECIES: prolyl oligopeptidase family serine peptidase [unclassified Colwellia]MBA6231749.1 S9 family peptidase [Colwellia sp. MB02u-7]MBA6235704.1 S9 family peptidase [Colwellia sp. MB02u-11]MBA6298793.1 S9 family peptidase [Colwellia sp. MB3u-22]MBA6302196.1 S9 family peptidase [Colwellia sp. MB02u-14]MBA6309700.1 S9 family peptidase [Colwellia sp. MB3u-64]
MKRLLLILLTVAFSQNAIADNDFKIPPKQLADLVDAPRQPSVRISADKQWVAILARPGAKSIEELAQPEEKLAGLRINASIFAPSRSSGYTSITLKKVDGDEQVAIKELPAGKIMSVNFSPNSQYLAFIVENKQGLTLWKYNLKTKKTKQVSKHAINASLGGTQYRWKRDSTGFYTRLTIAKASDKPQASKAKIQPVIQTTSGIKAAVRTYSNLLKTPYDEALFEFLTRSQLAEISLAGRINKLGKTAMVKDFTLSPDGQYLLVSQVKKPFSYLVPARRFPEETQVWSVEGKLVTQVADLASGENIPKGFDSVREGRRNINWRSDVAATLVWAEAQDGGSMKTDIEHHDYVYTWTAPFKNDPKLFQKIERRFDDITWGNKNFAMISDWRFSDRQIRQWKFNPSQTNVKKILFQERSYNDRYNDPGRFIKERNQFGINVIKTLDNNNSVYLTGTGASAEGNIPFLNQYDFSAKKKINVWKSTAPYYERIVLVLNEQATKVMTLRESTTEQPNFFVRDLSKNTLIQFTDFPHPTPAFVGVSKEKLKYKRKDGVELSGTLYLPADYDKSQGPLPTLIWAYPREYKDKKVAGQVSDSPYEFVRVSYWGPMPHLAQGFAVFSGAKMPIVGFDGTLPNDTFREQLVSSAQAAVDVLVAKGVTDKDRIAIAGHSYGAFMVANLLAHSDLFKAGIARSGAYNRTLTPFGFQGEERSFWEGQSTYASMSPFFHAEKINEPMLMIHGKEDPNSGTFPMQSERMFAALKGLGGNARLVMLPHEQHGYRARESLLHMLWEQHQWLDKYVKNPTTK